MAIERDLADRLAAIHGAVELFYDVALRECEIPIGPRRIPDQDRVIGAAFLLADALAALPDAERAPLDDDTYEAIDAAEDAFRALMDRWGWPWIWGPERHERALL